MVAMCFQALEKGRSRWWYLIVLGRTPRVAEKVIGSKSLIPAAIFFQDDFSANTFFVVFKEHERQTNVSLQGLVKGL